MKCLGYDGLMTSLKAVPCNISVLMQPGYLFKNLENQVHCQGCWHLGASQ